MFSRLFLRTRTPLSGALLLGPVFALLVSACQPPTTVVGQARVIDGDTLDIGTTRIRLHAVDAFEGRQTCMRDGVRWRCGEAGADMLRQLVDGRTVTCEQRDIDSYGRTVAVCESGTVDVGAELVRAGLALAYRQYGNDYVGEEDEARNARRGAWAGDFTPPWEWRRNPEPAAAPPAPAPVGGARGATNGAGGSGGLAADGARGAIVGAVGAGSLAADGSRATEQPAGNSDCPIKGNINRRGDRIYHMPGWSSYAQTRIDESRGERWFCSEAEALAAGWRAPRR